VSLDSSERWNGSFGSDLRGRVCGLGGGDLGGAFCFGVARLGQCSEDIHLGCQSVWLIRDHVTEHSFIPKEECSSNKTVVLEWTMSHMAQLNAPLPPAFRLVRQILSEQPRHFQEILKEGVAIHKPQDGASSPSSSVSTASSSSSSRNVPTPKGKRGEKAVVKVPDGHPFVSAK